MFGYVLKFWVSSVLLANFWSGSQRGGKPWRRKEGGLGVCVLSVMRRLGNTCLKPDSVLGTWQVDSLIIHTTFFERPGTLPGIRNRKKNKMEELGI